MAKKKAQKPDPHGRRQEANMGNNRVSRRKEAELLEMIKALDSRVAELERDRHADNG